MFKNMIIQEIAEHSWDNLMSQLNNPLSEYCWKEVSNENIKLIKQWWPDIV